MTTNPAGSIAIQVHQARERLAESEARAKRLAQLIGRINGDGPQVRALADAFAIVEDLLSQQRDGIATLEATERDVLTKHLEPTLEHLIGDLRRR